MDLNAKESIPAASVTVDPPTKPRQKKRQISVKRATKAHLYKQAAFLSGDLTVASKTLGIAYSTLYQSGQKHGWLRSFKSRNHRDLKRKLEKAPAELLGKGMADAWQAAQVARSLKHAEKLDETFEAVEDPSELNQVQKALDSVDVRARKALGLDKNEGTSVQNLVQVNLHTT